MSNRWDNLLTPLSEEQPGGENLEDTPLLASVEAYRVFGSQVPHSPDPEWAEIRTSALDGLAKSKDLLLLVHLGTAALRTDGLSAFLETLTIAEQWLSTYWHDIYPRVDEDAVQRVNALNCFADRMAVTNVLRRVPLVDSRQHGPVSLRDCEVAAGKPLSDGEDPGPGIAQIDAAFGDSPLETLQQLEAEVTQGQTALDRMDEVVRAHVEDGLDVDVLSTQLAAIGRTVRAQLAKHPAGGGEVVPEGADDGEAEAPHRGVETVGVGAINSREDAIRALEAVSEFFRTHEPSSPIPLFLDRAKRLVSKDFLEVLADVAPDGLTQAKTVGGVDGNES